MVLIETVSGIKIEVKPNKNIYEEFSITKSEVEKLLEKGEEIKSFSFQRIIRTPNHKQQSLLKDLSLPDGLNFWTESLDRKNESHTVWFKSNALDTIFVNYTMLLERLSEVI